MNTQGGIRAIVLLLMIVCCLPSVGAEDSLFGARDVDGEIEPDPEAIDKLLGLRGERFTEAFHDFAITYEGLEERGWPQPCRDVDLARGMERVFIEAGAKKENGPELNLAGFSSQQMLTKLIERADPSLLDRLALVVAGIPERTFIWPTIFEGIVYRLLEREFAALKQEGAVPLKIEWRDVPTPPGAAEISPTLHQAWARFVTMGAADRREGRREAPGIGFSTNISGYVALLDELLRGGSAGLPEKIEVYFSGGGCIGDPLFLCTAAPARWLALVRQRRLPEALRESFAVNDFLSEGKSAFVRREFLSLCGLDPAELEAGWWLARLPQWNVTGVSSFSDSHGHPERVLEWLALGSEQHAHWVVELARLAAAGMPSHHLSNQRKSFIDALGMVVERQPRDPAILGPFRSDAPPLPEALRREAATELVALLDANFAPPHLQAIIEKVRTLGLREAIEPLRRLMARPPADGQRAAAAALRTLGEDFEEPMLRGPVGFRLVSGGKPLGKRLLSIEFPNAPKPVMSASGRFMGSFEADEHGLVAFPWEDYRLVAGAGARMVLRHHNWNVHYPDDAGDTRPRFFEVEVPLPPEPPAETVIEIPSQRVTLLLKYARPLSFFEKRTIDLRITQRKMSAPPSGCVLGDWKIPAVTELTTWVQAGSYEVAVVAPGHAPAEVKAIEIRDEPVTVPVNLALGTDVHFEFVDETGGPYAPHPQLAPDRANPIAIISRRSNSQRSLLGLPPGDYTLSVPSTEAWHHFLNRGRPLHESAPRYAGKVVKFTIPVKSPPELNLGRVLVPRLKK